MISAVFNCFTIPFKVAFEPPSFETDSFAVLNSCIDLIFLFDILITFRTAFIDDYGNEINKPKEIAASYLSGSFWVDLSATIPIDQIIEAIMQKSNPFYELFGILKLGRVLRLNKIIAFLNVEEDVKASMKLFKMIFFLLIYIHFFACIWFLVVKSNESWVSVLHMPTDDYYQLYYFDNITSKYIVCIHSSVLSLLGSDIYP